VTAGAKRAPNGATALVLSGGGARGAYQVGALQGLLELGAIGASERFDILVGSSAGAINAAMLAAHVSQPRQAVDSLIEVWGEIQPQDVFRTDLRSLGGIGARWVRDLTFGGLSRRASPKSLLDTAPLRDLLDAHIPFDLIDANVESGALRAFAVPATDLYTSNGIIFLDALPEVPAWKRGRWTIERTRVRVEHVLASSAIPIFFPPVEVDGRHLGDGSVRNTAPLSPAINLGASRIVAIGVRQPMMDTRPVAHASPPSIAQVAAALLDAVMLDAVGVDVEHSGRVNTSVLAMPGEGADQPFRQVEVLWLSPTCPFHEIAAEFSAGIPPVLRYLLRGLGSDAETTELASYLLFDGPFCKRLIELGRADVLERETDVRAFFAAQPSAGLPELEAG
jgi:NTE family protein